MDKAKTFWWVAWLGLSWLRLSGCDAIDTCDSDQYYKWGSCRPCPEDAKPVEGGCRCDDPDKEVRNGECALPETDAGAADAGGDGGAFDGARACGEYCGFLRGCLAENALVASTIPDVVADVGIDGSDTTFCQNACVADANEAANAAALGCFGSAGASASCAGDQTFAGVEQALGIIDTCCSEHAASDVCVRLCGSIAKNELSLSMAPTCQ